jgi:opacity protein-like surface antigen
MKLCISILAFLITSATASAQDNHPSAEVFGGYSYLRFEVAPDARIDRQGGHGVGINAALNLSKWLGIAGDFSYNAKRVRIPLEFTDADVRANVQHTYFLFGPRFSIRGDSATGFFQALVGGAHIRDEFGTVQSTTDVALAIGGGVDVGIRRNVAIRAFQLDYLPSRRKIAFTDDRQWLQNVRAQVGVVIRFGGD